MRRHRSYHPAIPVILFILSGLFLCGNGGILRGQEVKAPVDSGQVTVLPIEVPANPIVTGFAVFGNEVTKPEIIIRELPISVGDTLRPEELDYMKARIYSLGLFNRVELSYPPMDSTILVIEVDERWFLFPVPIVGIVDRNWSQWYFGLGVKHENLRGRNEKLFAGGVLGYNPWAAISYSNPWIFGSSQLFSETAARYSQVVNRSAVAQGDNPNFTEQHFNIGQTLGKRFSPFHRAWLTAGFNYIDVSEYQPGRTLSADGRDRYLSLIAGAKHDTRDLWEYPTRGIFGTAAIAKKGLGLGDVDMMQYIVDMRGYFPVYKGVTLSLRGVVKLSSGPDIPNYEHYFFGFSERIRGHFYEEVEGENLAGGFAELRIPIIPRYYLHVPQIPIRQFATWKLGLYATLFFDTGTVWYKRGHPDWKHMPYGYGAGLNFLFPYSIVLRLDRAWNEYGAGEWIFDLRVAF